MSGRSLDDFNHERQALDAAHAQNEAGRDAFIALAHTALFAASVSFVGDVAPVTKAVWKPALLMGWTADVVGLLALTFSFSAARRAIDARRAALNDANPPESRLAEALNATALWSFPVALLCLFLFVTVNMVQADDRKVSSANTAELRAKGGDSSTKGTEPRRRAEAVDRSNPRASGTSSPTPASSAAVQEVTANKAEPLAVTR